MPSTTSASRMMRPRLRGVGSGVVGARGPNGDQSGHGETDDMVSDFIQLRGGHLEFRPELGHHCAGMHVVRNLADQAMHAKTGSAAFGCVAYLVAKDFTELVILRPNYLVHDDGQGWRWIRHLLQHY